VKFESTSRNYVCSFNGLDLLYFSRSFITGVNTKILLNFGQISDELFFSFAPWLSLSCFWLKSFSIILQAMGIKQQTDVERGSLAQQLMEPTLSIIKDLEQTENDHIQVLLDLQSPSGPILLDYCTSFAYFQYINATFLSRLCFDDFMQMLPS
jgi:hypothetical protein